MTDRAKRLVKRYRELRDGRSAWHRHWEDLAHVMQPRRMGFASTPVDGDRRTDDLFDGTPMQAARGLANAIGGLLRPDGQDWKSIKAADDALNNIDEVKDWLAQAQETLDEHLFDPKARFRQATGECDLDLVVFGTGIVFASEAPQFGRLMHQSIHLKDGVVVFGETGDAEGVMRCRKFTMRQAANKFGKDKLSGPTRQKLEEPDADWDAKIDILHVVIPRAEGKADALLSRNLPIAEFWIEVEAEHELSVGGFHEFPLIVPRFDTSSGEDYGRSPGMIALPDASTLQAIGETMLIAGQRGAAPPLLVPNDGTFDAANTFPDGITYYDADLAKEIGRIPIAPLDGGSNMPLTREMQTDIRMQVFAAFFRNVLNLPVDGPQMTAEEIRVRKEEFIREVGPVFGRLETDYTAPLIERDFKILLRGGAFGEIPEALQGKAIRFEYESPVKRIRQQVEAAEARQWALEMAEMEAIRPGAFDLVNVDELGRFAAEARGLPPKIVNGRDAVTQMRQQREEAQAAAAEMAAIQQGAGIAKDVAGAANQAGLVDNGAPIAQ